MASGVTTVLTPPRGGVDIGDYTLRDFAAKWLVQQVDLAQTNYYRAANRALAAERDTRDRFVLIGDSITEFWTDVSGIGGEGWRAVNRGIAGQNSTQMLLRFEDDVIALEPKLAILLCGTNDLRCYAGPPSAIAATALDQIRRNVTAMADIAHSRGISLVLSTLPPVGVQPEVYRDAEAIRSANRWIAEFARRRSLCVADYYVALADANGNLPCTLSEDGVHLNAAGYRAMKSVLRATLSEQVFLTAAGQSQAAGHHDAGATRSVP